MPARHSCLVYKGLILAIPLRLHDGHGVTCLPVEMRDEHGDPIPQPYPDTPDLAYLRGNNTDPSLWIVDMRSLPPDFTEEELTADEWKKTQADKVCKFFNKKTKTIEYAPGFREGPRGRAVHEEPDMQRSHVAFGGLMLHEAKETVASRSLLQKSSRLPCKGRNVLRYLDLIVEGQKNT